MNIFSKIKMKYEELACICTGTVIRLKGNPDRDWVCIHESCCDKDSIKPRRKYIKNETGFYLFSGLWYEGDKLTSRPYGKTWGQLEVGMLPDVEIIGNIMDNKDYNIY